MPQPNLLFVFDDQHRYAALGSSGNTVIRTPNLDRLAGEGVVLDQMLSSCPICSPYRGQLMTGRYSHCNGVMDNEYLLRDDQALLPQTFKSAGYRTGYVGKWHLGYPPYTEDKRYGFDDMAAYNCNHDYYDVEYYENETGPIRIEDWAPSRETDLAIRYMERHAARKDDASPFCLMLSWGPPHWPYDEYPRKYKQYNPAEIDLPPNVPKAFAAYAREEIADYYGNITGLDDEMGRLLAAVDRLGLRDDTIVIFTSDHGDHLSSHGFGKPMDRWLHHAFRASKATPYEESVHVPFIARWPGHIAPGARSDALVSSVDLMPTLLTICGAQVPAGVQGRSMAHLLLGHDGPRNDSVYMQILGPGWPHRGKWVGFWRGVRDARWTYARWYLNERGPFLFDRQTDPYEMNNLADHPDFRSVQKSLEDRLQQWMRDTGDPFDVGPRDLATGMLQLGQRFIHEKYER